MKYRLLTSLLLVTLGTMSLIACDDNKNTVKAFPSVLKKYEQVTTLEGVVSNNKGPIKTGHVKATDDNGQLIVKTDLENGRFKIDIPANTELPILLIASTDVDSEQWMVAVVDEKISQYQINPATTAIAKAAKTMGGYTRANLVRAAEESVHVPDANKTSTGWRGDPTTQYGGWH